MSLANVSRSFSEAIGFRVILAMALITHLKMMISSSTEIFPLQSKSKRRKTACKSVNSSRTRTVTSYFVEQSCIRGHQNAANDFIDIHKCYTRFCFLPKRGGIRCPRAKWLNMIRVIFLERGEMNVNKYLSTSGMSVFAWKPSTNRRTSANDPIEWNGWRNSYSQRVASGMEPLAFHYQTWFQWGPALLDQLLFGQPQPLAKSIPFNCWIIERIYYTSVVFTKDLCFN